MDGAEWLRTQLTSFGCAACGRGYQPEGIRMLAERDGLWFVDLACLMCGSAATAIVTVAVEDGSEPRAVDPELERVTAARPVAPIDLDDVLEMHRLLAGHQGDLLGLLGGRDSVEGTVTR